MIKNKNKSKTSIRYLKNSLLVDNSILVLGDIHIGYEEYAQTSGLIRIHMKDVFEDLEGIFKILDKERIFLKQIVILGDLKHEFGQISDSEWRDTMKFLNYLLKKLENSSNVENDLGGGVSNKDKNSEKNGKNKKNRVINKINKKFKDKIILIKGNHDNILGPIAEKKDIILKNSYKYNEICFIHGDKKYPRCLSNEIIIMGHFHPSIILKDEYKKERYKCFLNGKWKVNRKSKGKIIKSTKEVYVLPSFSSLSVGYNILKIGLDRNDEGFLVIPEKDIEKLNVLIYNEKEDQIYDFGKLKGLI